MCVANQDLQDSRIQGSSVSSDVRDGSFVTAPSRADKGLGTSSPTIKNTNSTNNNKIVVIITTLIMIIVMLTITVL